MKGEMTGVGGCNIKFVIGKITNDYQISKTKNFFLLNAILNAQVISIENHPFSFD